MSRIWWKKSPAQITLFCPRDVASFSTAAGGENESARSDIMAGRDRSSLNFLFQPTFWCKISRQDFFGSVPPALYNSPCLPYHLPITLLPHLMSRSMCTAQPHIEREWKEVLRAKNLPFLVLFIVGGSTIKSFKSSFSYLV